MSTRRVGFLIHPDLLSNQLGSALYRAHEALKQVVANAFDSDASHVDVKIAFNELEAPETLEVTDDGCGISPRELDAVFSQVGIHLDRPGHLRQPIGSKGIGRFAVFSLSAETRWSTVAECNGDRIRQIWIMKPGAAEISVAEEVASGMPTGTTVRLVLRQRDDVVRLLSSVPMVKRTLFNAFAGYLARYGQEVSLAVNGEPVAFDDFVDDRLTEVITADDQRPDATLHHLVLGHQVDQPYPAVLVFAAQGATIKDEVLEGEAIPARKYMGLVDSAYLGELTNTGKTDLADFDEGFRALRDEAADRAKKFISQRHGEVAKDFLEVARSRPFYPFRLPPRTPVDRYSQQIYDNILLALEDEFKISASPLLQQRLIFALTGQLLQSEDLAAVLTEVLGLKGEDVARFASLLKTTSLSSLIAVSQLLVDRLRFLDELEVLVYGAPAKHVRERRELHKIVESHTWLFGEQYHLMASDKAIKTLLSKVGAGDDDNADIAVDTGLRDIPDLYLAQSKWNEGAKFSQHLVVELKRPSVRVAAKHIDQLKRYAQTIVDHSIWNQKPDSHRFTFVVVSAEIADMVTKVHYQEGEELGLIGRPKLSHPTELWALRWSDFINLRRQELQFLSGKIEVTADPEFLEYLRERVGEFLPKEPSTT